MLIFYVQKRKKIAVFDDDFDDGEFFNEEMMMSNCNCSMKEVFFFLFNFVYIYLITKYEILINFLLH